MIRNLVAVCGLALLATVLAGSLVSAKMAASDSNQASLRVAGVNRNGVDTAPRSSLAIQRPIPIPCGLTGSEGLHTCIALPRGS